MMDVSRHCAHAVMPAPANVLRTLVVNSTLKLACFYTVFTPGQRADAVVT